MSEPRRRTVLVYGASGAQGGPVARRLLGQGDLVRVLVRDEGVAEVWRAAGAEVALGDLGDRESLERASAGVDAISLHLPQVHDDRLLAYGRNAIDAAAKAGVGLVVFNTSSVLPPEPTEVPFFERKRTIEDHLAASGPPAIRLRPTSYMDNLLGPWTKPGIASGVVAHPAAAGARLAWIAQDDMAGLTVAALGRPDLAGRAFTAGGPEALTGEEIAVRFTEAFTRPVRYQSIPLDAFEQGLAGMFGPDAAREIVSLYRWEATHPEGQSPMSTPGEETAAALGMALTPIATWIGRQDWTVPEAA